MNKLNGKIFYERLKLRKGNCVLLRQILVETAYSSMYIIYRHIGRFGSSPFLSMIYTKLPWKTDYDCLCLILYVNLTELRHTLVTGETPLGGGGVIVLTHLQGYLKCH